MGVISITSEPDDTWQVAGWAFRQILDDTAANCSLDEELKTIFETAQLYDGLSIELLTPSRASEVMAGLRHTTENILNGRIESGVTKKPYGSLETQEQYNLALRQLLTILQKNPRS